MVWPEEVRLVPPGVKVIVPATKLVGFPVNGIPSIVYVDNTPAVAAFVLVVIPVPVLAPAPVPMPV